MELIIESRKILMVSMEKINLRVLKIFDIYLMKKKMSLHMKMSNIYLMKKKMSLYMKISGACLMNLHLNQ